jgi:hypothetical protein
MDEQDRERDVRDEGGESQSRLPLKPYTSPRLTTHGSITKHTIFLVPSGLPS